MKMYILQNRNSYFLGIFFSSFFMLNACSLFKHAKNYETHESRFPEAKPSAPLAVINKTFCRNTFVKNTSLGQPKKIENIHFGFGTQIYVDSSVQMVNESSVDLRRFESYKSVSLFPKSQFAIDPNIKPLALKTFSPLLDSIVARAKKRPSPQLIAQILIYGYTDGIQTAGNSPLYKSLRPLMTKVPMTKENMNRQLSYLRATELGKIINEIIDARISLFEPYQKVFIQIVQVGKGEEMPDQKKKYKVDDERRRVVKIYWKVD